MSVTRCLPLIALLLVPALSSAQSISVITPGSPARIDARLAQGRALLHTIGPQSRFFGAAQPERDRVALLVRQRVPGPCPQVPGAAWIARSSGGPLEQAALCAGWLDWAALELLSAHPAVAELRWAGAPQLALPDAPPLVSVQRDAQLLRRRVEGVDGRGVRVVQVDGPVDLLHPALFYDDGGLYSWVDVDQDGLLTPGVDGVDLDQDGRVSPRERLWLLNASRVPRGAVDAPNEQGSFESEQDWLYLDRNVDGRRNAGPQEGFREEDLAYGEPIFVVDDIDQDGALDPHERLVRLGRSKIARVIDGEAVYTRGVDLIRAALLADDSAFHGTAVSGLIAGGQPDAHTLVGLAPGAELEVHVLRAPSDALVRVARALEATSARSVVVHEWSLPDALLDGGGVLDGLIAAASQRAPQLVAAGNMHLAQRHVVIPQGTGQRIWRIPAQEPRAGRVELVVQWDADVDAALVITSPDGQRASFEDGRMQREAWGQLAWSQERSSRGARLVRAVLWVEQGQLPAGDWRLEVSAARPVTMWARVFDLGSPWRRGVGWAGEAPADGSLAAPAAAPGALVLTALGGLEALEDGSAPGELRRYAGRGPTLLGELPQQLAAPDDAFAPLYVTPARLEVGWGAGWYAPFSGTSGALAMGAGAVALMRQRAPEMEAPGLIAALLAQADDAALVPPPAMMPDVGWGSGRLAFELPAAGGQPPRVQVEAWHERARGVLEVDASGCEDPDGGAVQVWIDVGYDGRPEVEWAAPGRWTLPDVSCGATPCLVRVKVRDAQGEQRGALLTLVQVTPPMEEGEDALEPDAEASQAGPGCGCGAAGQPVDVAPLWGGGMVWGWRGWARRARRLMIGTARRSGRAARGVQEERSMVMRDRWMWSRRAALVGLCGMVAALCVGCGGAATSDVPPPGALPDGARFSGVWYSPQFEQMYLRQIGDEVRGVFEHGYGGTIEGKIQGDLLVFKWIEPGDRAKAKRTQKGRGYFKIIKGPEGWLLDGKWGYEESAVNGGIWTAERTRDMDDSDPKTLEEYREKNVR
jgi:subtilisin family serine protease